MARRSFTREFKLEAVRLVSERGMTVAQAQLKKEIRKLKAERDILKKASAYFARESN